VGSRQALRMVVACFGIVHFYGIIGVLLAWFPSWFLAWSMLETRGLTWVWLSTSYSTSWCSGSW
jgi:hypothetical protein